MWDLQPSFAYSPHFYDSSNILWLVFEIIDGMGRQRLKVNLLWWGDVDNIGEPSKYKHVKFVGSILCLQWSSHVHFMYFWPMLISISEASIQRAVQGLNSRLLSKKMTTSQVPIRLHVSRELLKIFIPISWGILERVKHCY